MATSTIRAVSQVASSAPDANGRRMIERSSMASGRAFGPVATATPMAGSRLRVRNQTVKVSPWARHGSRPYWAISARVRTV